MATEPASAGTATANAAAESALDVPAAQNSGDQPEASHEYRERRGRYAAELLKSSPLPDAEVRESLNKLLRGEACMSAFCLGFGPRRLLRMLTSGGLSAEVAEIAESVLELSMKAASGDATCSSATFSGSADMIEVFREELYPDLAVELQRPMPGQPACREGASAFEVLALCADVEQESNSEGQIRAGSEKCAELTTLYLHSLSRREMFGAEIECKVWPASLILARWLWCHPWLVEGKTVLELGAGVGLAGLGAARSGGQCVLLTDINEKALRCAKENVRKNALGRSASVCRLDWAEPPEDPAADSNHHDLVSEPHGDSIAGEQLAGRRFDMLLAADIVNADGLPALVMQMIRLFLADLGVFVMCAPKSKHRHKVDELRALLLDAADLNVRVCTVPLWLRRGSEEAADIAHELYVGRRKAREA